MPAPVTFTLSLAPLPVNFSGTLQDWATAVVARLTIAPSAPWSSFQNGGAIGVSDVGPILYQGVEWRVFDTGLGAYTYLRVNGAGIVAATIPLTKLSAGTAGSVLVYSGAGAPSELLAASGTNGQVLTLAAGAPVWTALPTATVPGSTYFETTLSAGQNINTDGSTNTVAFDTVKFSNTVTFDTTLHQIPVVAGQVWYFYGSLQVEDAGAATTGFQMLAVIGTANDVCTVRDYTTAQPRDGFAWGGVLKVTADGFVKMQVVATETTPATPGVIIAANIGNTRFGGYRIA